MPRITDWSEPMNRHEILDKIEHEFFLRDICGVKLEEIAKSIGVKRPTLYHYFESKESLVFQLVERSYQKFETGLTEILAEGDLSKFIDWSLAFPVETRNMCLMGYYKNRFTCPSVLAFIKAKEKFAIDRASAFLEKSWADPARVHIFHYTVFGFCSSYDWTDPEYGKMKDLIAEAIREMLTMKTE